MKEKTKKFFIRGTALFLAIISVLGIVVSVLL
jgi:hypothetical protein